MNESDDMVTMIDAHAVNAGYWGDRGDWLIAAAKTRDSEVLDEANFDACVQAMVGPAGGGWAIETSGHWAVGHIDYLLVRPRSDCERIAREIAAAFEDYPCVDESLYSEYEWRDCVQGWTEEIRYRLHVDGDTAESIAHLALDAHDNVDSSEWPSFEDGHAYNVQENRNALAAGLRAWRKARHAAA